MVTSGSSNNTSWLPHTHCQTPAPSAEALRTWLGRGGEQPPAAASPTWHEQDCSGGPLPVAELSTWYDRYCVLVPSAMLFRNAGGVTVYFQAALGRVFPRPEFKVCAWMAWPWTAAQPRAGRPWTAADRPPSMDAMERLAPAGHQDTTWRASQAMYQWPSFEGEEFLGI